jgi:hypothetical protein
MLLEQLPQCELRNFNLLLQKNFSVGKRLICRLIAGKNNEIATGIVCIKSREDKGLEEPYKTTTNPRKRLRSLLKTTYHISTRPLTGKKIKNNDSEAKTKVEKMFNLQDAIKTISLKKKASKLEIQLMNGGFLRLREIHQEKESRKGRGNCCRNRGKEIITPLGLTPQNKTMNTGMFIFDTQISHKFVGYNNSTDHGKAVFKNNKENGSHLLAQPDRTNVQTTNLSDPQHIFIYLYFHIFIKSEI